MYHAPVESSERCWVFLGWLLHNHWHNLYLVNLWFLSFLHYLWSLPSLCCTLQWLAVGKSCFSEVGLVTAHEFEEVGFEFKNKCELINLGQINKALLCKPVSGLWSRFLTKPEFNLGPAPPLPFQDIWVSYLVKPLQVLKKPRRRKKKINHILGISQNVLNKNPPVYFAQIFSHFKLTRASVISF